MYSTCLSCVFERVSDDDDGDGDDDDDDDDDNDDVDEEDEEEEEEVDDVNDGVVILLDPSVINLRMTFNPPISSAISLWPCEIAITSAVIPFWLTNSNNINNKNNRYNIIYLCLLIINPFIYFFTNAHLKIINLEKKQHS